MAPEIEDYLITEFTENFAHKRHFQNQRQALIGLYFTVALAVPIILDKVTTTFYQGILLVLVFTAGTLVFVLLIKNRHYSTVITRQINSIRNHFVSKSQDPDIKSIFSEKYLNKDYPPYLNFKSDSFVIFVMVGFLNSVAISLATNILFCYIFVPPIVFLTSIILHLVVTRRLLRQPQFPPSDDEST